MPRTPSVHSLNDFRGWIRECLLRQRDQRPLASLEVYALGLIQGICTSVLWTQHRERVLIIIEEVDRLNDRNGTPHTPPVALETGTGHPDTPCRPLANSTCPGCRDAWRRELNLPAEPGPIRG